MLKQTLLVGAHFRPPAKLLLQHLPAGTPLELLAEPENPYDEHAVQVMLNPSTLPREGEHAQALAEALPGMGMSLPELFDRDTPIHLGYLAASTNKELRKYPDCGSNLDWRGEARAGALAFGPSGEPRVEWEDLP